MRLANVIVSLVYDRMIIYLFSNTFINQHAETCGDFLHLQIFCRQDMLDGDVIARLVDVLKHPSSDLQRRAASVLEYVAITDSSMDSIISANIESGLLAVFQQKILTGM